MAAHKTLARVDWLGLMVAPSLHSSSELDKLSQWLCRDDSTINIGFFVAAWYAQACRLLYVCMFVGHTVNEISEIWQQISRTLGVRTRPHLAH